jgi:hypothetical protein
MNLKSLYADLKKVNDKKNSFGVIRNIQRRDIGIMNNTTFKNKFISEPKCLEAINYIQDILLSNREKLKVIPISKLYNSFDSSVQRKINRHVEYLTTNNCGTILEYILPGIKKAIDEYNNMDEMSRSHYTLLNKIHKNCKL